MNVCGFGSVAVEVQSLGFCWPNGQVVCAAWSARLLPGLTLLVGGDGAGKTTRLRLLASACQPQSGQLVLTLGADSPKPVTLTAWPTPADYRRQVFWCDPASDALDGLLAAQYADHHRAAQRLWREEAFEDLLAELGLKGHLGKPLLGLSMGMRRKLRLACALASGAAVTLIDDPMAALDHRSCTLVSELLADCATSSQRVFVSTAHGMPPTEWGANVIAL